MKTINTLLIILFSLGLILPEAKAEIFNFGFGFGTIETKADNDKILYIRPSLLIVETNPINLYIEAEHLQKIHTDFSGYIENDDNDSGGIITFEDDFTSLYLSLRTKNRGYFIARAGYTKGELDAVKFESSRTVSLGFGVQLWDGGRFELMHNRYRLDPYNADTLSLGLGFAF